MDKNQIQKILGSLFLLGILLLPVFFVNASEIGVTENDINVELSPENPEPYQNVTIKITSYATDLNKAMVEWRSGNSVVLSGFGKTSYSYKAMGPNTSTSFQIIITPVGTVERIVKELSVTPSEVEIMWESVNGYAPSFYRGKVLPTSGSQIRAVAIPNTNTIKSGKGNITYTWKSNGSTVLDSSGYNKDSYTFKNSLLDTQSEVTVTASSLRGDYQATKTIRIPIGDPKIIFYKKSPAEGILYNNALNKETNMSEEEMTIVAEPYFMSISKDGTKMIYNWKINGQSIETPAKKTELTIRPTSRGGYATINLVIENLNELLQKTSNQLKINL